MTRRTFLLGFGLVPLGLWIDRRLHHRRRVLEWTTKPTRKPRLKEKKMKRTSIGTALLVLAFAACQPTPKQCAVIHSIQIGVGVADTILTVAAPALGIGPIFQAASVAAGAAIAVAVAKCESGTLDPATLNDAITKAEALIALYKLHQAEIPAAVVVAANTKGIAARDLRSTGELAYAVLGQHAPPEAASFDPDAVLADLAKLRAQ